MNYQCLHDVVENIKRNQLKGQSNGSNERWKKTIEFHSPQSIRSRVDLQGILRREKNNEMKNSMRCGESRKES